MRGLYRACAPNDTARDRGMPRPTCPVKKQSNEKASNRDGDEYVVDQRRSSYLPLSGKRRLLVFVNNRFWILCTLSDVLISTDAPCDT